MPMPKRRTAFDSETLLARAALTLLETKQWRTVTLASVARSAGLSLSDVLSSVPSKSALPGALLRLLAHQTMRRHTANGRSHDPRERLFDATMTFFDVQEIHARALKNLYRALQYDLPMVLAMRHDILRLAGELVALAEADVGQSPRLQAGIFAAILIRAISAWCDDGEDMGKTMSRLDGDLRSMEGLLWPKRESTPAKSVPRKKKKKRDGVFDP